MNVKAALLFIALTYGFSYAAFSPDVLYVKTRSPLRVSALDGQLSTESATLNDVLATVASGSLPFAGYAALSQPLERIIEVRFESGADISPIATLFRADDEIEWVAFNNHYSTVQALDEPYTPNDSLYPEAWWLDKISAGLAWDITRGDPNVLIGIIDTGVDHEHRDLRDNIWRNPNEIPENGIDDDDNGFIDDVIGWDFVDAPSLPSGGDFLVRDNDPMDDFGHGTYVAGCAAASSDNLHCYPSIGFNCRIMPLRAGNANGTLEEDDIAAAVLYGAANGAAVINMSFGDVVASPLLREVIQVAFRAGVVLVASAGNASNNGIHYPSGFAEVISVGATDFLDRRAGFSNLGPSVDIMAPGAEIRSTILGGGCGSWIFPSGTSYASPLVAGLAGLMLSVNHNLTPDDVLDILRSSADDINTIGWDSLTVNGRINARRAVEAAAFGADAVARIFLPVTDSGVRGNFAVVGDAKGTAFSDYLLEYGLGENPTSWTLVTSGNRRVQNDTLGLIQAPATDTVLVIRLTTRATNQSQSVDMGHTYVQNASPQIDSIRTRLVIDGPGYGLQITAWSNQICRATLLMTNASGDSIREDFGYVSDEHVAVISQSRYPGHWQAVLQLTNLLGEIARSDPFSYSSVQSSILPYLYNPFATTAPHGILGSFTSDYDCDGHLEMWLLPVDQFNIVDTLEAYEWATNDFVETENTYGPHIPQCYGDADGDGLFEMGARRFQESRIWEQTQPCGILNNIVFESTPVFSEFLISRYVTIDSASGRDDILARTRIGTMSRFALFVVDPDFNLTMRDTLPNYTDGLNSMGPPGAAVGDFDQDGLLDIIYGDYDGDLIWCEWTGSEIQQVWTTRMPQNDATSWLATGDFDCDGVDELVAGCRSNAGASSESQRLLQGWDYYIFESHGNNELTAVDSVVILGNENVSVNPASVAAANVNVDGCADILVSAFPDFYVITRNETTGRYEPEWHYFPSKSGGIVAADFNGNGIYEILMSDGTRQLRIENSVAMANAPYPPVLVGHPQNETTLKLNWTRVQGSTEYRLYMDALPEDNFELVGSFSDTFYVWTDAEQNLPYRFAVATYDTTFEQPQSTLSNILTLIPNSPPAANDTAEVVAPKTIAATFNEAMSASVFIQGNWRLADGDMPAVIAESEGMRKILIVFDAPFAPGTYHLMLRNLSDAQGTPLPLSEQNVFFVVDGSAPNSAYVTTHRLVDSPVGSHIEIEFSEPMLADAVQPDRYTTVDPRRGNTPTPILSARFVNAEQTLVELQLDERFPVGAVGVDVRIQIQELSAMSGNILESTSLLIGQSAQTLDQAYVYPNPFRGKGAAGTGGVFFAALPNEATIRIFSIHGALLKTIDHNGPTGHAEWDLRTSSGDKVASGIYLYTIESSGDKVTGKIAVAR